MHVTPDHEHAVAIVGMACRVPGAKNAEELWANLRDGVECIAFFSEDELRASGVAPETIRNPRYVPAMGWLEDADRFDAGFFSCSPREAEIIDPQQRVFLECAWEALEDAGEDPARFAGRVGVYGGVGTSTYFANVLSNRRVLGAVTPAQVILANAKDYLCARVSYKLNLNGPSLVVQTGCSTSLVAVHLAVQGLLCGECDLALAGGVRIDSFAKQGYFYQEGDIVSPDGHCRAFDALAHGTVPGHGVAIVALQRFPDAVRDQRQVYALIRGSAINNDGSLKVGFTAPSIEGQSQAIADAWSVAGVSPSTAGYVEAHGTGTELGDPVEVAALTDVFRQDTERKGGCALGSLKTNMGHLDVAAGVAGLMKAALALKHRQIPPSLHFQRPNPKADLPNSPFYVNAELEDWAAGDAPRRAGVSSFGIGGTNAHCVLEEAPLRAARPSSRSHQLLPISARSWSALDRATERLLAHLRRHGDLELGDVAFTLQNGRRAFPCRRFVVCRDLADAVDRLAQGRSHTALDDAGPRPVAFLFPGQGTQYVQMGAGLYAGEAVFRRYMDECFQHLRRLGLDLEPLLYPSSSAPGDAATLTDTSVAQPALFAVEYALAQLWMAWGIQPSVMLGHSLGEYVAACLAGVLSLEQALDVVVARGRLMQALPRGSMLAVALPEEEVRLLLNASLSLAAVNGPSMTVVSGTPDAVDALVEALSRRGVASRRLHTSHAFHSFAMDGVLSAFRERVRRLDLRTPRIPYVSNLTGALITGEEATDPEYWVRHLRETVRFGAGVQELARERMPVLLEVGPGQTLSTLARRQMGEGAVAIGSLPAASAAESDVAALLGAAGRLWASGVAVDWEALRGPGVGYRVSLPAYPFEHQRYWVEPDARGGSAQTETRSATEADMPEPAPALEPRPGRASVYAAPRDDIERALVEIWQEVLGVARIGIHDNFFDLGGDSIVGLRAAMTANDRGLSLAPHQILESQTIAELAARMAGGVPAPQAHDEQRSPAPAAADIEKVLGRVSFNS